MAIVKLTRNAKFKLVLLSALAALLLIKTITKYQDGQSGVLPVALDYRATVTDSAGLMTSDQQHFVVRYHDLLLRDYDIDYRVLTVNRRVDISRFSAETFAELLVGEHSKSGRGLLLVLDTENDKVRLEVSANLEGTFTDGFVAYLQQRQMVYFFSGGRVADGILAATELIYSRAQDAEKNLGFAADSRPGFSIGGGALTTARLNRQDQPALPAYNDLKVDIPAGQQPIDTVNAYLQSLRRRDARADKAIFTRATQAMMRGWVVTPAQMDNELKIYRQCPQYQQKISGSYAVILYQSSNSQCVPRFLSNEEGLWKLDLLAMQKSIVFNHRNQWRLKKGADPDYLFAFAD